MALMIIPGLILLVLIIGLMLCVAKKYPKVRSAAAKLKEKTFFNIII
jgi:hypothetical protein